MGKRGVCCHGTGEAAAGVGWGERETHYWETLGVGGGIGAIPSRKDPVPLPSIWRNTIFDILLKW